MDIQQFIARLRRLHTAERLTVSIGPVLLRTGTYSGVVAATANEFAAFIPLFGSRTVSVYHFEFTDQGEWRSRYIGDLPLPLNLDALHEAVSALIICPRCGGSGEVRVTETLESGIHHTEWEPCPECCVVADEPQLPF